jgi:hypothetical protein
MAYKWSEMEPRERDALVALRVMGFSNVMVMSREQAVGYDYFVHLREVPYYTTDMSAAWKVIEKFHGYELLGSEHGCICTLWIDLNTSRTSPNCDTAPEAICIAALRAVGVDVE